MKRLLRTTAVVVAIFNQPAQAETLFCVDEASGGIKFVEGTWTGVRFSSGKTQYVVSPSSDNENAYDVKQVGKSYPDHRCIRKTYDGALSDQMTCGGLGYGLIINFATLRYVEIYTLGYIEDDQSGENTPFVSGGKCSVISP